MSAGNRNIGKITKALYDTMIGLGYDTFTQRPESVPEELSEFIVVSVPSRIIDLLGYGKTTARVSLYARSKKYNGYIVEDIAKLQSMQDNVYGLLPIHNKDYVFSNPVSINLGADRTGFNVWHINIDVIII